MTAPIANPSLPERRPLYVEVSPLLTPHLTGIARFAARLMEALTPHVALRLFTITSGARARHMRLSNALRTGQEIHVPAGQDAVADEDVARWVRRLFYLPLRRHDARQARDCPALYTMLRPAERHFRTEINLLHDFTPLLKPQWHVAETCSTFGAMFTQAAPASDHFIANSYSTRADATWLCRARPEAIEVYYPGPTLCVRRHACSEPVERRSNVLLVVSTLEPRKNGRFLLHWFLHSKVIDREMELWWVGPNGWKFDLHGRWLRGERGRRIRFLGVVPDRRLCQLYREAAATIYPSLYEGFGFPVLDALRHQTPVLCSYNSSLQEFEGPGVFYFDACDAASLDQAYLRWQNEAANRWHRPELEQRYSWDRMARRVLDWCA